MNDNCEYAHKVRGGVAHDKIWSLVRIALGLVFLWAFFDKLLGLGGATKSASAWLAGGSPTSGFLAHSTGPLAPFYQNLAGVALVDWLFMLGLLGLGVSLIVGIGQRLAGWLGALLMVAMWSATWPVENNPFIDDHIVYALLLIGFATTDVGNAWSLRQSWKDSAFVSRHRFLE